MESSKIRSLRIAVLVTSRHINRYISKYIDWCKSAEGIVFCGVIVCRNDITIETGLSDGGAIRHFLLSALLRLESRRLAGDKKFSSHLEMKSVDELGVDVHEVSLHMVPDETASATMGQALEKLKILKLDLIVDFGVPGGIADISQISAFGLLQAQMPGPGIDAFMTTGFSEVMNSNPVTDFFLKHFTTERKSARIVMRGNFPTRHYYLLNQAALCEKSSFYLRYLTNRIREVGSEIEARGEHTLTTVRSGVPSINDILRYAFSQIFNALSKKVRRTLAGERKWNVAFSHIDWQSADLCKFINIDNPPSRYLADPFVFQNDDGKYVFVEDVDEILNIGKRSVYRLLEKSAERIGVIIDEKFHLSFPFPFLHDGKLYICPESSANNDIRVYRCVRFPCEWVLDTIIMDGVVAVDTMLIPFGGKWWMFTNIEPADIGDSRSELYLFSSDSPLSTSWKPHKLNPIIVDALTARNGGVLLNQDRIFRVSQRQGFDQYGKESQINEITSLNDEEYSERVVGRVTADFFRGAVATHHLHSQGGTTVVDYLS